MINYKDFYSNIACISDAGQIVTYKDLEQLVNETSKLLESRSVCFILCSNSIGSLVGYLSALHSNSVALLLNKDIDETLLNNLVSIYEPNYLFAPHKEMNINSIHFINTFCEYDLFKVNTKKHNLSNDLSLLLTTSGTTGSPKLVKLSKANLLSNALSIKKYLNITSSERAVTSLPMYYSYGLSVINSHLLSGATLLLTNKSYIQREFWDFAKLNGVTSFSGVPYTYEILNKLKFWETEIPTLKMLTQAGGKLSDNLIQKIAEKFNSKGIAFIVMYGQTEATARMSYLPKEYVITKLGSIGKAIPGGNFKIINDGVEIKEPNVIGELVYSGENVFLGYANKLEDLSLDKQTKKVLYTGDLAYFDEDGFFFIAGRKKRFLKLFGNRISLDYVESLLKNRYNGDFACVGTDKKMIIYDTTSIERNELLSYISNTFKLNRSAFEIRKISEIPHSDSGKTIYSQLLNE